MARALPKELVSLIYDIELNRAGWWDKGIQQLIVFIIWRNKNTATKPADVIKNLQTEFNVSVDNASVERQIQSLMDRKKIIKLPDGRLKLSENTFREVEKVVRESEELEQEVFNKFTTLVNKFCPSLDAHQLWADFYENFLVPTVRDLGASVFWLLGEANLSAKLEQVGRDHFERFISKYPEHNLRDLVDQFLDPKDAAIRSYILRIMNTCFYIQASGLEKTTLKKIATISKHRPSFHIFVDTNFLFSVLDLHDNPSNEAAKALMELTRKLSSYVQVKFYVAPITIQEAKRALIGNVSRLEGIRTPPNILKATESSSFSGVAQKFFEARRKTPAIDAKSFFDPYINNMILIAREAGVELYNEAMDEYKMKQEVIDDIEEQREIEMRRGERGKSYEALEHDMILWHFVKDRRPAYTESPLEAKYWIVTVDYRFIAFDRSKGSEVPICIHPTALIQMLRFWLPRTEEFERALFTSLRLPLFFSEFDTEAEEVTLAILRALSRFEGVEDLPEETIVHLLVNDSLRARVQATRDEEQQVELIREALIEEQASLKRELEQKEQDVAKKTEEVRRLEYELKQAQQKIAELEEALQKMEESRRKEKEQRVVKRFLVRWVAVILPILLLIGSLTAVAASHFFKVSLRSLALTTDLVFLLLWLLLFDYKASKSRIEHKIVVGLRRFKSWIISGLLTGIVANFLWEWIKR